MAPAKRVNDNKEQIVMIRRNEGECVRVPKGGTVVLAFEFYGRPICSIRTEFIYYIEFFKSVPTCIEGRCLGHGDLASYQLMNIGYTVLCYVCVCKYRPHVYFTHSYIIWDTSIKNRKNTFEYTLSPLLK